VHKVASQCLPKVTKLGISNVILIIGNVFYYDCPIELILININSSININ
jgi:hypothetical protein